MNQLMYAPWIVIAKFYLLFKIFF